MPAKFVFFSVTLSFLYSFSGNINTSEESSSLVGDNLVHFGFVGISPRPLTSLLVCNLFSSHQTRWF